ncbi:MAG: ATP-binding cassette domain-containing protein [Archangium sp.]|nr:ATP-binding cassette domain-containing protein [Archangium sp.]
MRAESAKAAPAPTFDGRRSRILEEIWAKSLLSVVPGLGKLLVERGAIRVVAKGQAICRQNTEIKQLILPLSGGLQLSTVDRRGETQPAGFLKAGRSLALRELLLGRSFPFSAIAEQNTSVLFLERAEFIQLLERHPQVAHYLRLITASAGLRKFRQALVDSGLSMDKVVELFSLVRDDTELVPQGRPLEAWREHFIFVASGALRLTKLGDRFDRNTVELGEGAYFGGAALVSPFRWAYEAVPLQDLRMHVAPIEPLRAFLSRSVDPDSNTLETLYDEPCILAYAGERTTVAPAYRPAAPLPGKPASQKWLSQLRFGTDLSELVRAEKDHHTYAASVANFLSLKGRSGNFGALKEELEGLGRVTALRLATCIEPYGVQTRLRRWAPDSDTGLALPVLTRLGERLVVLLANDEKRHQFLLHDPVRGFVEVSWADLALESDGWVLEGSLTQARGESPLTTMATKVLEHRTALIIVGVLSLIEMMLGAAQPKFMEHLLDDVLTLRDTQVLWGLAAGYAIVALLQAAVDFVGNRVLSRALMEVDYDLQGLLYRRALGTPLSFFSNRKAGEMLTRLGELEQIRGFVSGSTLNAVTQGAAVFLYVALLASYSASVAVLALGLGVTVMALQIGAGMYVMKRLSGAYAYETLRKSLVTEQLSAITTVKASRAEKAMLRRYCDAFVTGLRLSTTANLQSSALEGAVQFLGSMARVGGLWFVCNLALQGSLSPGAILAASAYLGQVVGALTGFAGLFGQYQRTKLATNNVATILNAPEEFAPERASVTHCFPLRGKIKLEHVHFKYPSSNDWVLRDVSLTIFPQQVVAIVGRSGCGKTTLANLIAGNVRPSSGRMLYDQFDSTFVSLPSLRRQIGYIMQGNDLFQGTLEDNIAYGDDAPEGARVMAAANDAHASGFIDEMPMGMKQFLGEGGMGLSGGQKQRLAIARTLYRAPQIMIMDEATSALDAESEQAVVDSMREILKGKTSIVIAHRLSTIRNADRILVMRDGQIVEDGTHTELLERGGHYAELFEHQLNTPES